jgi:hypothetical protein
VRRLGIAAIATLAVLGLAWSITTVVTGRSASPRGAAVPAAAVVAPLQLAAAQDAGWTYSLDRVAACAVGDGVTVVKNVGAAPLRIDRVAIVSSGDLALASARFELVRFGVDGTTGEVAGSTQLAALRNGQELGPAVGGLIAPVRSSGWWYDVVALLRDAGGSASTSRLEGLRVEYTVGRHTFATTFPQSVRVPAFPSCA